MFGQHKRPTGDPKKNVLLERQQRSARKKDNNHRFKHSSVGLSHSATRVIGHREMDRKDRKRPNASFF
jgi:hypothetical protein